MTLIEALETTKIHSVVGRVKENTGLMSQRPFRSPHHTIFRKLKSFECTLTHQSI